MASECQHYCATNMWQGSELAKRFSLLINFEIIVAGCETVGLLHGQTKHFSNLSVETGPGMSFTNPLQFTPDSLHPRLGIELGQDSRA